MPITCTNYEDNSWSLGNQLAERAGSVIITKIVTKCTGTSIKVLFDYSLGGDVSATGPFFYPLLSASFRL